jgi:hypothetical protein
MVCLEARAGRGVLCSTPEGKYVSWWNLQSLLIYFELFTSTAKLTKATESITKCMVKLPSFWTLSIALSSI